MSQKIFFPNNLKTSTPIIKYENECEKSESKNKHKENL